MVVPGYMEMLYIDLVLILMFGNRGCCCYWELNMNRGVYSCKTAIVDVNISRDETERQAS